MAELKTPFYCQSCGRCHPTLPLSFSVKVPLKASRIPGHEVAERVVITRDQCVIDGVEFFLRGRIAIPVIGLDEPFIWGVWAEISPKSFIRTHEAWYRHDRESDPPYGGWLDTDLPIYGTTINLEVEVQTQPVGRRPHFAIVSSRHPLGIEQRHGITLERVRQIAAFQCAGQATSTSTALRSPDLSVPRLS